MQEYHVDCHPDFLQITQNYGDNLSVHTPSGYCPEILIGHDKCFFKANWFAEKYWNGSKGLTNICPMDDKYVWMLSLLISQVWTSFNVGKLLTSNRLAETNLCHKNQQYISIKSEMEVSKQPKSRDQ